jgi:hypothetical protein
MVGFEGLRFYSALLLFGSGMRSRHFGRASAWESALVFFSGVVRLEMTGVVRDIVRHFGRHSLSWVVKLGLVFIPGRRLRFDIVGRG